jgi:heme/copper-type cytochrome/quinol oxidase subunit 2
MFLSKRAAKASWCIDSTKAIKLRAFKHLDVCLEQKLDAPEAWQCTFQDPASPNMEGIIDLHHNIMFILIVIVIFVLWMLIRIYMLFNMETNPELSVEVNHHLYLEWV